MFPDDINSAFMISGGLILVAILLYLNFIKDELKRNLKKRGPTHS